MKINMKKYILFLGIFLFLLNILTNLLVLNLFFKPKRIAVIDFITIKNDYVKFLANKSNEEQKILIQNFTSKANKLIAEISKNNNLIILPKQAVFDGEDIDLTKQFRGILLNE